MELDTISPSAQSASAPQPILSHGNYSVGWISALPLELTAAQAMLDQVHPPLSQSPQDDNIYTLGAIGKHNVVLACLPSGQMGNNSATAIATQMRSTFPAIRFGLMVGIGGGCPSVEHDIRLGDVVVSKPGKNDGGVVQFDFGRTVEEGRFVRNGVLNAPPAVLLSAISAIQATHSLSQNCISRHLSSFNSTAQKEEYAYQGSDSDLLFQSDYDHSDGSASCQHCDKSRLVTRKERSKPEFPVVHYGTIASGNQVMRHGATRERLSRETGALCFEMEAAGLMNTFACLVIRGICDYADSHKSKVWQGYAAATAAAYAKELLSVVPATSTPSTITSSLCNLNTSNDNVTDAPVRLSCLPFQRNPFFSGRKSTLESIDAHFRNSKFQQAYILQGMGGLGKTQIALEYTYQAMERGFHGFWVDCTSQETMQSDFQKLKQTMPAETKTAKEDNRVIVLRWLESHVNWVLVFDNADDSKFPYGDWIPDDKGNPSGRRILFTTRDERLATAIVNFKDNIPLMNQTESVELFNIHAPEAPGPSDRNQENVIALVQRLGNLPLAITLASAYLREYPLTTIENYLQLLEKFSSRSKLFGYKRSFSNYNHSIMSTWEVSFVKVQDQNPRAAEMLTVLGFLENGVDSSLLHFASSNIVVDKLSFLEDGTELSQALGLLKSLALVYYGHAKLSLHPLVHEWIQARLNKHDLVAGAMAALRVIYNAWVADEDNQNGAGNPPHEIEWISRNFSTRGSPGHTIFALGAVQRQSVAQFEVHEDCYFLLLCILVSTGNPDRDRIGEVVWYPAQNNISKRSICIWLRFLCGAKLVWSESDLPPPKPLTFDDIQCHLPLVGSLVKVFQKHLRPKFREAVDICTQMALLLVELRPWWACTERSRYMEMHENTSNLTNLGYTGENLDHPGVVKLESFVSLCDLIPTEDDAETALRFPPHILKLLFAYVNLARKGAKRMAQETKGKRTESVAAALMQRTHQLFGRVGPRSYKKLQLNLAMSYATFVDQSSLGPSYWLPVESCLMKSMKYVLDNRYRDMDYFFDFACQSMWESDHDLALWKFACFIEPIDGRIGRKWKEKMSDRWKDMRTDEHRYKVRSESERKLLSVLPKMGIQ